MEAIKQSTGKTIQVHHILSARTRRHFHGGLDSSSRFGKYCIRWAFVLIILLLAGMPGRLDALAFQSKGGLIQVATVSATSTPINSLNTGTPKQVPQSAGGIELTPSTPSVAIPAGTAAPAPVKEGSGNSSNMLAYVIGTILLLTAVLIFVISHLIKSYRDHRLNLEWEQKVVGVDMPLEEKTPPDLERTLEAQKMGHNALGQLTVTASDDPSLIGQRFEITSQRMTLGRKTDNDIIFANDSPVSRHHAQIKVRNGGLFLSEVEEMDETGRLKRPIYGTFVNKKEVGARSILLKNGDEIRLGKRVHLKFEAGTQLLLSSEKTIDTSRDDTMDTHEILPPS